MLSSTLYSLHSVSYPHTYQGNLTQRFLLSNSSQVLRFLKITSDTWKKGPKIRIRRLRGKVMGVDKLSQTQEGGRKGCMVNNVRCCRRAR